MINKVKMKRIIDNIIPILFVLIIVIIGIQQRLTLEVDYFVSPGESINDAIQAASAGDTIHVNEGIYHEVVRLNKAGITLIGDNAVIDGEYVLPTGAIGGTDPVTGNYFVWTGLVDLTASNIVFDGFKVTQSLGRGIRIFGDVENVRVFNTNVHQIRETGILVNQDSSNVILNNVSVSRTNNYAPYSRGSSLNWGAGLSIKGSDVEVSNCRVFENWGEGILIFAHNANRVNVHGCEVFDNYALQLYIDHGQDIEIWNNRFYFENPEFYRGGTPPTSLAIANESFLGSSHTSENIIIRDNEFEGGSRHFGLWGGFTTRNVEFRNNVLRDGTEGAVQVYAGNYEDIFIVDNIIYQTEGEIWHLETEEGITRSGNVINPPDVTPTAIITPTSTLTPTATFTPTPTIIPTDDHQEILDRLDAVETQQAQTIEQIDAIEALLREIASLIFSRLGE